MLKKIVCVVLSVIIASSVFSYCAGAFDCNAANDSKAEVNYKIEDIDEPSSYFTPFNMIMGLVLLITNIPSIPYRMVMFPYHVYLLASGKMSLTEFLFLEDGILVKN